MANVGTENEASVVKGSFSWTSPDGKAITANYFADEDGYYPQGADIPVVALSSYSFMVDDGQNYTINYTKSNNV